MTWNKVAPVVQEDQGLRRSERHGPFLGISRADDSARPKQLRSSYVPIRKRPFHGCYGPSFNAPPGSRVPLLWFPSKHGPDLSCWVVLMSIFYLKATLVKVTDSFLDRK